MALTKTLIRDVTKFKFESDNVCISNFFKDSKSVECFKGIVLKRKKSTVANLNLDPNHKVISLASLTH